MLQSRESLRIDPQHPGAIAAVGEEIYRRKYQAEYERLYPGMFCAIDVMTEDAYIAEFSGDALKKLQEANPRGLGYLLRIGHDAAFTLHTVFPHA